MLHNNKIIFLFVFFFLTFGVFNSALGLAFNPADNVSDIGSMSQLTLGNASPLTVVIDIVAVLTSFLGILFLLLIIYAGFIWMTASGNEEKIKKAQTILKRSLIGLIIVLMSVSIAYLIWWLIISATVSPTTIFPVEVSS